MTPTRGVTCASESIEEADMDWHEFPVLAGTVSTLLFVVSYLPMLVKAFRTRDLESYSRGNLLIANVGNGVHSIYVFSLPPGPIWALHGFYVVSTAVMLIWHRLYVGRTAPEKEAAEPLGCRA